MKVLCCLLLGLSAFPAQGQEAELLESEVVRNRLFRVEGRVEAGVNIGFSPLSTMTEHYNLSLSGGYNFTGALAAELRVGYAISGHTGFADETAQKFFAQSVTSIPSTDDLSDLWELKGNAVVGIRWQPIYGKLGMVSELPIHFQVYVWAGGGVAMLERESVTICNASAPVRDAKTGRTSSQCTAFLRDNKVDALLSVAVGLRFFVSNHHVVRFEVRDWSWPDSFLVGASRVAALSPSNPTGSGTRVSGITNLVQAEVGYSVIF